MIGRLTWHPPMFVAHKLPSLRTFLGATRPESTLQNIWVRFFSCVALLLKLIPIPSNTFHAKLYKNAIYAIKYRMDGMDHWVGWGMEQLLVLVSNFFLKTFMGGSLQLVAASKKLSESHCQSRVYHRRCKPGQPVYKWPHNWTKKAIWCHGYPNRVALFWTKICWLHFGGTIIVATTTDDKTDLAGQTVTQSSKTFPLHDD